MSKGSKAYAYYRYSSDNQREESIEAQRMHVEEYAERNGIEILDEFVDRATTGSTTKGRVAFQRMMETVDLYPEKVDFILVHKNDRFGRNVSDVSNAKMKLKLLNVRVISTTTNFDDSPEGFLGDAMQDLIAEYYIRNLSREVEKGFKANIAKGYLNNGGTPPFGYRIEDRKYIIDEDEAKYVRMIFNWVLEGQTYGFIIDELSQRGCRTRRGGTFKKNSIYDLLRNRKYIGEYSFGLKKPKKANGKRVRNSSRVKPEDKKYVIADAIPRLVSDEDFYAVQKKLSSRSMSSRARQKVPYLLKGNVVCGYCGGRMHGTSTTTVKNGKRYKYYQFKCSSCKDNKSINKTKLEKYVLGYVIDQLFSKENMNNLATELNNQMSLMSDDTLGKKEALKNAIKEAEKEAENLMNVMMSGLLQGEALESVTEKYTALLEEKNESEEKLDELKTQISESEITIKTIKSKRDAIKSSILENDCDNITTLFQSMVEVIIYKEEIELRLNLSSLFYVKWGYTISSFISRMNLTETVREPLGNIRLQSKVLKLFELR